jgi:glucuronate isomerase
MKTFMDEDFLLETETAKKLYHQFAKDMPIYDYHCHLSAKEIAENKSFSNMTEIWLNDDHYKWRALRFNGIEEKWITGDGADKEKFIKWAETVPYTLGNPLYHWTHLELQRYFGITENLSPKTAEKIWTRCNELLNNEDFTAQELIKKSNVKALCTTDDPLDDLKYHKQLLQKQDFNVKVLPTFRPDGALSIEKESFTKWIDELQDITNVEMDSFSALIKGLSKRIIYFHEAGCRLSDHSFESNFYIEADKEEVNQIFKKAIGKEILSKTEVIKYKTALMIELGKLYHKWDWAMQLHIGALRNNNTKMLKLAGQNTGFDSMGDFSYAEDLSNLLNSLVTDNSLPKTILYNLNPRDNYMIASMVGNFQEEVPGKVQFGTAWWFGDQRDGIVDQIKVLSNCGLLARFIGMLTDSRSFLSYTRHEYFRRILCNVIGSWVENGEYPQDFITLEKIVKDICYFNVEEYLS